MSPIGGIDDPTGGSSSGPGTVNNGDTGTSITVDNCLGATAVLFEVEAGAGVAGTCAVKYGSGSGTPDKDDANMQVVDRVTGATFVTNKPLCLTVMGKNGCEPIPWRKMLLQVPVGTANATNFKITARVIDALTH